MKNAEQLKPNFAPVYAAAMYPGLAAIFQRHGYALAAHGSLARDLDLIAVPWVDKVSSADAVLKEVTTVYALRLIGHPTRKNHGRIAYTLSCGFGECAIDLSFVSIKAKTTKPTRPMKKLILSTLLALAVILPVKAQTNTPKLFGGIPEKIIAVGKDWLAVNTNALTTQRWTVAPYVTYAPDAPENFGGGVFATYEVTQYLGTGIGLDYLGRLTMPSGNVTLKLPIKPFARFGWNQEFTPFAIGALAIPVSGAGDDNGPVATIVGAGVSTKLFTMKQKPVTGGFAVVDWQNAGRYSGRHWEMFLALHF